MNREIVNELNAISRAFSAYFLKKRLFLKKPTSFLSKKRRRIPFLGLQGVNLKLKIGILSYDNVLVVPFRLEFISELQNTVLYVGHFHTMKQIISLQL